MTAPVGLADVIALQSQLSTLQTQLNALSAPVVPRATRTSAAAGTAAAFASTLASVDPQVAPTATGASTGAATGSATGSATGTAMPNGGAGGVTGASVVADAQRYLGVPYVWGAESASGLDCSGLVQKTYADLGITLPRVAADQQKVGTPVGSLAQAQPGDLLFFGQPAYHVAIYAGNGRLIESPEPGKTVHITDVYQTPTSIRRIVSADSVTAATPGAAVGAAQLTAAGLSPAVAAYAGQFTAAEQANRLPAGMLAAVAQQESGGNPGAVSPAGARGLMQLMPSTAAAAGVDAFDPAQAIPAAARILARDLGEFGSVPLALAAYNAGAGAVHRYGGIPPYAETQNYVRRITSFMAAGG